MKKINIKRLIYQLRHKYLTLNNIVLGVAFLIGAGWVWGSLAVMEKNYTLQRDLDNKERQLIITQLDVETERLAQRYYQTEEYQELEARKRLGLGYPGEKVLILPPNTKVTQSIDEQKTPSTATTQEGVSNFDEWMNFLFGRKI